jgi:hypothetical protein
MDFYNKVVNRSIEIGIHSYASKAYHALHAGRDRVHVGTKH